MLQPVVLETDLVGFAKPGSFARSFCRGLLSNRAMDFIRKIVDIFLHLDRHLAEQLSIYGFWIYGLLFLIVFMETGLVVTPILPGDSLLFAAGALSLRVA